MKNTKIREFTAEEVSEIIFSLFPEDILKKYQNDDKPLKEQFIEFCKKNYLTVSSYHSKRLIKKIALYSISINKKRIKDTLDFSIFIVLFI